jgi:hypothetical protein
MPEKTREQLSRELEEAAAVKREAERAYGEACVFETGARIAWNEAALALAKYDREHRERSPDERRRGAR